MKYIRILLLILIINLFHYTHTQKTNYPIDIFTVDFDISMGKNHPRHNHLFQKLIHSEKDMTHYYFFKELYKKNNLAQVTFSDQPKIPKTIHQIWLSRDNTKKIPKKYRVFQKSWQKFNPDWEYRLWTNSDIKKLGLENKALYDKAINYGERADIARYEILHRFGGLYVDTDFECFQSFDILHHCYHFYTGLQLPALPPLKKPLLVLPNGLIGCCKNHPIMRDCIDTIKNTAGKKELIKRAGPLMFINAVLEHAGQHDYVDIVLPASFFYPMDKTTSASKHYKKNPQPATKAILKPESFAVHHWAGSWILKEQAFVPGIKLHNFVENNIFKTVIIDNRKKY